MNLKGTATMQNTYIDIIYTVGKVSSYQGLYSTNKRHYNTEETYYENELHILSEIVKNNDVTLLDIAKLFYKTKSYISQVITGLENKGLLIKARTGKDARKSTYQVTEKGMQIYLAHYNYDAEQSKRLAEAMKEYTPEQMQLFLNMLKSYHNFQLADTNAITKQIKKK